jgi:cation:H+ antiporter
VVLAGSALARHADAIAEATKVGRRWIGSVLLAGATSLPELTTDVAAVRLGAVDLAVGDLFGSSLANMLILNACNMAVFLALDLAQPGSLFAALDPAHALSALSAVVLMSLGLAAIVYRARRRFAMIEPGSALIVVGYVLALWLLWDASGGGLTGGAGGTR